jgi:hypothetical protein
MSTIVETAQQDIDRKLRLLEQCKPLFTDTETELDKITGYRATVINFIGAPGAGKSTQAAGLFTLMKRMGYNVELVTEYAKDCVWRDAEGILSDQVYVFGKQHNRLFRLRNKVDFIISDSPLILSLYYAQSSTSETFSKFVIEEFNRYRNYNFFVNRTKTYNPMGRMQTEIESDAIGKEIHDLLQERRISYVPISSDTDTISILQTILRLGGE